MITNVKRDDVCLVCGGKTAVEHIGSVIKDAIKTAGVAYCLTRQPEDFLGRVVAGNEVKKRVLCSVGMSVLIEGFSHFGAFCMEQLFRSNSTEVQ